MAENNSTNENRSITQIQVGDSTYDLNATYWNGKPFKDYKIDGQSIYDGGSISIFKKYSVQTSTSLPSPLEPNTKYIFKDPITSLDFTGEGFGWGNGDYNYCEYTFIFKCGDDVEITESDDDWYWADGAKPSLESDVRYELSVSVINTDGTGGENIVHAILVPFIN
jgi:hypothetical protein